jgi:hypothetical protein
MTEEYELTNHVKVVMKERNIPIKYLEDTISEPMLIEVDKNDMNLQHRLKPIKENENRVLRVIINRVASPIKVVN